MEPSTSVNKEKTEDGDEEIIAAPAPTAGLTYSLPAPPALAVDESEILLFAPFGPDYLEDEDEEGEQRPKKRVKKGRGKGGSPSTLNYLDQGMSSGFGQFSVR